MKKQLKKLTASASALTMLAASMSAGGVIASAMVAPENPTTSDYTFTIPSTPTVTQAGYNATDGVTAKGTLAKYKKLVITADSTDGFALVSGDNEIGYNLVNTDNAETKFYPNAVTPSWEFKELNANGVTQPLGIVVEDFEGKPRGQYTDTVTFTAKLEDTIPLQSISLNKSAMVLFTEDGYTTKQLSVTFNPEDTTDDKTVTWSSSNPTVATVDQDGNVTAVATGSAKITATTANGITASCNVAVNMVTITSYEAPYKALNYTNFEDFIKDGIVKVSFNSNGNRCANKHDSDGWYFYGDGATVTVTSEVEDSKIAKVKFYTKNGSTEVTNAPFTVYSYSYHMYTGINRSGTCFNDWGVNKIEVYLIPVDEGDGGIEAAPPEAEPE